MFHLWKNSKKNTIQDLVKKWQNKLDLFDLEIIIANELQKNQSFIIAHPEKKISFLKKFKIGRKIKKRAKNVPLAYLTGKKEFYGRNFLVSKNVLIPRPETELIVENVLKKIDEKNENYLILDIGTGSGNIIITLSKELQNKIKNEKVKFIATDISKKALKIAKKNANNYKLKSLINFFHSNLLKNKKLIKLLEETQNEILIIANLPYVNEDFKTELLKKEESKSLKFEPNSALWSSDKGLNHYENLLKELSKNKILRNKKINSYFEISPEQTEYLQIKIKSYFPKAKIEFKKDLAGLDRLCIWKN